MNTTNHPNEFSSTAIAGPVPGVVQTGAAAGGFSGFLMLMRSQATLELLRDHKAFTLLALIAYRARRGDGFNVHNLKSGEALIGDHKACGLTPQGYREAKQRLSTWGFATFKGTSKGTIAHLIDSRVWDINTDANNERRNNPATNQQRTNNEPTTTNKNERRGRRTKSKQSPHTPQGGDGVVSPVLASEIRRL